MTISQHKSIAELYADLCIRLRELQKLDADGGTICLNCGMDKRYHSNYDGMCDVFKGSPSFRCSEDEERRVVERALTLIEELRGL